MENKMTFVRDCSGSVDPKVLREYLDKITARIKDPNVSEKGMLSVIIFFNKDII